MTDLERNLRKLIADQQQTIRRQAREISELRSVVAAYTAPYEAPRAATAFLVTPSASGATPGA